jgi:hypothetical protein
MASTSGGIAGRWPGTGLEEARVISTSSVNGIESWGALENPLYLISKLI